MRAEKRDGSNSNSLIKKIMPLIFAEVYLVLTLLLLSLGPIQWNLHNAQKFWFYIVAYHLAFIAGYLIIIEFFKAPVVSERSSLFINDRKRANWLFLILSAMGSIVFYRNLTRSSSYISLTAFRDFIFGLLHPATAYYNNLSAEALERFHGNTVITLLYALIAFARVGLICFLIHERKKLNVLQWVIGIFLSLIPAVAGVTVGTNKPIFDTVFYIWGATLIEIVRTNYSNNEEKHSVWRLSSVTIPLGLVLLVFAFGYFNKALDSRVGTSHYIEQTAGKNEITVETPKWLAGAKYPIVGKLYNGLAYLAGYVDQGYYGMSLALDLPLKSTYGVGNSMFLLNTFKKYLHIDLFPRTFQHRISKYWDEFCQWHSFYSQMANDVGFAGVIVVMLILGMSLAICWKSILINNDLYSKFLLIMFMIMIIYMPANNQLFNIMDSLFAFWEFVILDIINIIRSKRGRDLSSGNRAVEVQK